MRITISAGSLVLALAACNVATDEPDDTTASVSQAAGGSPSINPLQVTVANPPSNPVPTALDRSENVVRPAESGFQFSVQGNTQGGYNAYHLELDFGMPVEPLVIENINAFVQVTGPQWPYAYLEVTDTYGMASRRYVKLDHHGDVYSSHIYVANESVKVYGSHFTRATFHVMSLRPDGESEYQPILANASIAGHLIP